MTFIDLEERRVVHIIFTEDIVNPLRREHFVLLVGDILDEIPHLLAHLLRKADTKILLQDIVHAAFP